MTEKTSSNKFQLILCHWWVCEIIKHWTSSMLINKLSGNPFDKNRIYSPSNKCSISRIKTSKKIVNACCPVKKLQGKMIPLWLLIGEELELWRSSSTIIWRTQKILFWYFIYWLLLLISIMPAFIIYCILF